jgi:hypothetical protein
MSTVKKRIGTHREVRRLFRRPTVTLFGLRTDSGCRNRCPAESH